MRASAASRLVSAVRSVLIAGSASDGRNGRRLVRRGRGMRMAEALERRTLLAAVSWDGGGDGTDWFDANNWSGNMLPRSTDDVTINVAGSPTIHFNGDAVVKSLVTAEQFELAGGTLTVSGNLRADDYFRIMGGTLADANIVQGSLVSPFAAGKLNNSVTFGDVPRRAEVPEPTDNHLDLGTNATIETWARFDQAPSGLVALVSKDPGGQDGFIFGYNQGYAGNATTLRITQNGYTSYVTSNSWEPVVGQWYHLAVVKSGTDYTFYRDGVGDGTVTGAADISDTAAPLQFGEAENTFRLVGAMDDVRIWNTARTDTQIAASRASELTGGEAGLAGYWKMNATSGRALTDSTSHGSNGTVRGDLGGVPSATASGGRFDSVTLSADMTIWDGASINLRNSLTLNGATLTMASRGNSTNITTELYNAPLTIGGTGSIVFDGSAWNNYLSVYDPYYTSNPLTITSGVTLRGAGGYISSYWNNGHLVNQGTIQADLPGQPITITSFNDFTNAGTLKAINGGALEAGSLSGDVNTALVSGTGSRLQLDGTYTVNSPISAPAGTTLTLNGTWVNASTITISDATLNLGGQFMSTGTINRSGGTVNLTGVYDLSGSSQLFDATTGSWYLRGGTIKNGTISFSGGNQLLSTGIGGALDDVTLASDWTITDGTTVSIRNTLTLSGTTLTLASEGNAAILSADLYLGTIVINGTGEIVFGGTAYNNVISIYDPWYTANYFIIGTGITVRGSSGYLTSYWANATVYNNGTIQADVFGQTITINSLSAFHNAGTLKAINGGTLDVENLDGYLDAVEMSGDASTLVLNGAYVVNSPVTISAGTMLILNGAWTNDSTITMSDATLNLGGQFTLAGLGTLNRTGGTVRLTGLMDVLPIAPSDLRATAADTWVGLRWVDNAATEAGYEIERSRNGVSFVQIGTVAANVTSYLDTGLTPGATYYYRVRAYGNLGRSLYSSVASTTAGGSGSGLLATYYNTADFSTPAAFARVEWNIDDVWQDGAPDSSVNADFAGRWTGKLAVPKNEEYTFYASTDDGVRLWIDGTSVIDDWNNWAGERSGAITLTPGQHDFRMEFFDGQGPASASLSWSSPTMERQLIPAAQFTLPAGAGATLPANVPGPVLSGMGAGILAFNATTGSWELAGGTIRGGTLTFSGGNRLIPTANGGYLDGVTLASDWAIPDGTNVTARNTLTLNGTTLTLASDGGGATLYADAYFGAAALGGTGSIVFGGTGWGDFITISDSWYTTNTLTIGPGVTVHGGNGQFSSYGSDATVINEGTIMADVSGQTITIQSLASFTNAGTLGATNGATLNVSNVSGDLNTVQLSGDASALALDGDYVVNAPVSLPAGTTLTLGGTWSSTSTITVSAAALNLGGQFTSPGAISRSGGQINLTGTYDLLGGTKTFNAASGSWYLKGGTMKNGKIAFTGANQLIPTGDGGYLDAIILASDLTVGEGASLYLRNGLTFDNSSITLVSDNYYGASLYADLSPSPMTIGGNGEIVFGGASTAHYFNLYDPSWTGNALTIGGGVTIRGRWGYISSYWGNSPLINNGTIQAEVPGQTISISSLPSLTNNGILSSVPGLLEIHANVFTNAAAGIVNLGIGGLGAGADFGYINVFNSANLDGTLNVALMNGFAPAPADVFDIISGVAVTGTFATANLNAGNGYSFVPSYRTDSLRLVAATGGSSIANRSGTALTVNGTNAADTLSVVSFAGILLANRSGTTSVFSAADIASITMLGNDGNDTLTVYSGIGFGVSLSGGNGADTLNGGVGNDTVNGGEGSDSMTGGLGNDTFVFADASASQTDTVNEQAFTGTDLLDFSALTGNLTVDLGQDAGLATMANRTVNAAAGQSGNFENVFSGAGSDLIGGNDANNTLVGNGGNDTLRGFGGDDSLDGGAGNDILFGGAGTDSFAGGAGTNQTWEAMTNASATIAENSANATAVLVAPAYVWRTGQSLSYTILSGNTNAAFAISNTGQITVANVSALNYEVNPVFTLSVGISDGRTPAFADAATVTVNLSDVNEAPTDIALSSTSVAENQPSGTTVGTFSVTDQDSPEIFVYALVLGTGSTDNASFTIIGNTLKTAASFNYEAKKTYSIRVQVSDRGALTFEKVFTISVTDVNEAPTAMSLSGSSVAENQPVGTTVGSFSATDPDSPETLAYTLVSGTGSTDNASFTITGNTLKTAASLNYEVKNSYSIRVRVTDQGGLTFERVFTITVTDVNETPTDITLSSTSVAEHQAAGTPVGTFSTTDPDTPENLTYALVSGTGSTDNASFTITGNALKTAASFNYEARNSYSIRVRVTDKGGLTFEKALTIAVTDVNETPTDIALSGGSLAENQPGGTFVGTFATTDPDTANTFAYTLVTGTGGTDNDLFQINGYTLATRATLNYEAQSSYSIRVRSTDQGGLFVEKVFTITLTNVNETPTDIALVNASVQENQPAGTLAGVFNATDPDSLDTFTYALVTGTGSTDNASFTISGDTLRTVARFDYETRNSYSIRVRVTDGGGLSYEKPFTISVIDTAETAPVLTGISNDTGVSATDRITSDRTLVLRGTSEPQMTVNVSQGATLLGSARADASGAWVFDYSTVSLADGQYSFTATASDTMGHTTAASAPMLVTVDGTAPAAPAVTINSGAIQRSMVKRLDVSFAEPVSLAAGALGLKFSSGAAVPATLTLTNPSGDGRAYVLTFSGTGVVGGSLADGIYDLIVSSAAGAGVQDLAGNALTANYTKRFHRLFGDVDGNKVVNALDYAKLKATYGRSSADPLFNGGLDYESNNVVNALDLAQFRKRYGLIYSY